MANAVEQFEGAGMNLRKTIPFEGFTINDILDRSIPEPNSGCWLWAAGAARGYGSWPIRGRKYVSAHRMSFAIANGGLSGNWFVCHKCDVTLCVNPEHLFLGTNRDNMRDMAAKGRQRGGVKAERHHQAKLTSEDIRAIRADGRSPYVMAGQYGVSARQIYKIKTREAWASIE